MHSERRCSLLAIAGALPIIVAAPAVLAAEEHEKKVGATEDLMREHGVLRRALHTLWPAD